MSQSNVAIIGKNRLAEEIHQLGLKKGLTTTLYANASKVPASTSIAIETLPGTEEEKKKVIRHLDTTLSPAAVTVTSCLGSSTTQIASWTRRPERVVGFATFFPMENRGVIELAGGIRTEEATLGEAEEFFTQLGKDTARVKDAPGLIFPRILSLIINEAVRSLDEGIAVAEEIDVALQLGTNYPLGPLRWADQVGLDEVLMVLEGLQRETGDDRYRPSPLLKKKVIAGHLGEVSGQGFYRYDK